MSLALAAQETKFGKIILKVEGIESSAGNVMVAVYDRAENFNSYDKVFAGKVVKAVSGSLIIVFDSIPAGYYAISGIHDKNANGDMDKNRLGIPVEKFGFSQNVMGSFGPPSFNQARIKVEAGKPVLHTMRLRSLI